MKCECCNKEHNGNYGSGRFCSRKCARSFSTKAKRKEINEKVSKKLKGTTRSKKLKLVCKECGKEFIVKYSNRKQQTCSNACRHKFRYNKNNKKYLHNINSSKRGGIKSAKSRQLRSKNEIYFYKMCNKYFNRVEHNKNIFNGWDADIIIHDIKVAVLWNGKWHYKKITENHSVKQVQNRDKIKIKEIEKLGYTPYIIKDMGKYNKEFVKEKFNEFLKHWGVDQVIQKVS